MFWIALVVYAAVLGVCGFIIRAGDRVIRMAGCWLLANIGLHTALSLGHIGSPTLHLTLDGIYAVGLLPLAFYSVSPWIGALTFLAASSFLLQSTYLLTDAATDGFFILANNLICTADLLTLLAGTIVGLRRRRREAIAAPDIAEAALA